MASSRLEKIGTIFTRTTGLLRSGAMKLEDKPVWYDVVAAFPPKYEPRFDRPAPNIEVKPIYYADDIIRAKFYERKSTFPVNLLDRSNQTNVQKFIKIYKTLEAQGALDQEKIFETAYEMLEAQNAIDRQKFNEDKEQQQLNSGSTTETSLVSEFSDAQVQKVQKVKISDIFKE